MFNFIYPYIPAYAADDDDSDELKGGPLFEPLFTLVETLAEAVMNFLQQQLLGLPASVYVEQGDSGWLGTAVKALQGAVAGGVAGGAVSIGAFLLGLTSGPVGWVVVGGAAAGGIIVGVAEAKKNGKLPDNFYMPLYHISPQEIFGDQIPALSVNFINPKTYSNESDTVINTAKDLSPVVSKWYVALRNLVLVGLMVVLLYIGIRIVISSTANEKAKYKEHIKDWIVAVILVVFMHYIMVFALTITEYITGILVGQNELIRYHLSEDEMKAFGDASGEDYTQYKADDGNYYMYVNLMGYTRLAQQIETRDADGNKQITWDYIGYTVIFIVLVIYTVMFLVIYLKRVVYMAFLTIIAPLVALTYPIDKISDGKAQAFDMWLKEYVYNLLIQPFHLLLYTILVGSAMDLAQNNMLYAIVAIGFLMPAEKLLRRFFGFDKAPETGSIMGSVVGGSMAMGAIGALGRLGSRSRRKSGGSSGSGKDSGSENDGKNTKIRTADKGIGSNDDLFISGFGGNTSTSLGDGKQSGSGQGLNQQGISGNSPQLRMADTKLNGSSVQDDDLTSGFNPNSDYEGRFGDFVSGANGLANSVVDSKGVLGDTIKDKFSNIRLAAGRGIEDWQSKTPKTAAGRNLKRLTIRGARSAKKFMGTTGKVALGTAARYTGKGLTAVAKRAPRLVAKAAVGATLGGVGVAAGVATGDWSKVAAYGATAATAGANLGEGISNMTGNAADTIKTGAGNIRDDYMKRRYTSDELKAKQNDKADKEWQKDKEVIRMYQEKFGKDGYEQAMVNALEYRKHGITDDKTIIAAQKLEGLSSDNDNVLPDGSVNRASQERIALAKAATMVKSDSDMKSFNERLENNGISKDKIKEVGKNIRLINKM